MQSTRDNIKGPYSFISYSRHFILMQQHPSLGKIMIRLKHWVNASERGLMSVHVWGISEERSLKIKCEGSLRTYLPALRRTHGIDLKFWQDALFFMVMGWVELLMCHSTITQPAPNASKDSTYRCSMSKLPMYTWIHIQTFQHEVWHIYIYIENLPSGKIAMCSEVTGGSITFQHGRPHIYICGNNFYIATLFLQMHEQLRCSRSVLLEDKR